MNVRITILCLTLVRLSSGDSQAQGPVTIRGGNVAISITTGVPEGQPLPVVNTITSLNYRRSVLPTKITVSSSCPAQKFSLKVLATSVTLGIPSPEVTLVNGMFAADFITNIPPGIPRRERCTLRYTGSATYSQGNSLELGNDTHVVTYTVVAQ